MRAIHVPAVLLLTTLLGSQVDPETAAKIREEGLERSQVMAILKGLSVDIGHRLTGSDNFTRACYWTKDEFERFGLENVHLEQWAEWPVTWNREQWSGRIVAPEPLELQVATEAWTAGTLGRQTGRLLRAPKAADAAAFDPQDPQWRGAWIYGPAPRGELRTRLEGAGILGYVNRSQERDAQYPTRMRVFGNHRVTPNNLPKLPQIVVRQDQADAIERLLDGEKEVTAEFDIRNRFRLMPISLHNVIAEIPGTEKPDECVIVCGHLDSWHQAGGTTDNGTGSASTMEAARILAKVGVRPRRTIRFILWGGEEEGLLGSNGYVTKHRTEMPKVSCVFNHDTGTNWAYSLAGTDAMSDALRTAFAEIMKLQPPESGHEGEVFKLTFRPTLAGGGGGSDHASFLAAGVPAWSWGLKGRSDYFRYTWHTQWDTYDVAIPEYMRHTSTVVALAALGVANLPELLSREGVGRSRGTDLATVLEPMLGCELDGTTFKSVTANGLAAKAGIKAGDKLVEVNGEACEDMTMLRRVFRDGGTDPVRLSLKRGTGEVSVLMDRPPRRERGAESQPAAPQTQPARQSGVDR